MTKEIHWEKTSKEHLARICPNTKNPVGCTINPSDVKSCNIFTLDTIEAHSNVEQLVLGHEVMHCFNGKFHK